MFEAVSDAGSVVVGYQVFRLIDTHGIAPKLVKPDLKTFRKIGNQLIVEKILGILEAGFSIVGDSHTAGMID